MFFKYSLVIFPDVQSIQLTILIDENICGYIERVPRHKKIIFSKSIACFIQIFRLLFLDTPKI